MIDIDLDSLYKILPSSRIRRPFAAAKDSRDHLANLIEFPFHLLALGRGDHRAKIYIRAHGIADSQISGAFNKAIDEFVGDGFENVKAFARGAHLTHVQISSPYCAAHGNFEIDVIADDERIVAAKFEIYFLDAFGRELRNAFSGGDAAGECDDVRVPVAHQRFACFLTITGDDVDNSSGKFRKG